MADGRPAVRNERMEGADRQPYGGAVSTYRSPPAAVGSTCPRRGGRGGAVVGARLMDTAAPSRTPVHVLGVSPVPEADSPVLTTTLGLRGHDDEIEIRANVVVWRAGGKYGGSSGNSSSRSATPSLPSCCARCTGQLLGAAEVSALVLVRCPRLRRLHAEGLHAATREWQRDRGAHGGWANQCSTGRSHRPACDVSDPLVRWGLRCRARIQAAWCLFSATQATFSLCVLQPEVITIYEAGAPALSKPTPTRGQS
jgi:hypothetical protein